MADDSVPIKTDEIKIKIGIMIRGETAGFEVIFDNVRMEASESFVFIANFNLLVFDSLSRGFCGFDDVFGGKGVINGEVRNLSIFGVVGEVG